MSDLPVTVTKAGAQPTPPETLLARLIANVSAEVPGYTANLPPSLITDLASTAVGALALIDQAMVDAINSVTPYGANVPLLDQLGNIYGAPKGAGSNTSVYIVFTGLPGFVVPKGFVVSDGNHQYTVQANTVIPGSGQTNQVYCLATTSGSWAVPAGSVTQVITSVPASQKLTCTNTEPGLPGNDAQNYAEYRAQVMQSGMATVQGVPDLLKTMLSRVEGVKKALIAFRQINLRQWAVVVGGGDPYEVAHAIYQSVPDISVLTGEVHDPSGNVPTVITSTITSYPDSYQIPFIVPISQQLSLIITWNATLVDFSNESISSAVASSMVEYIESIGIGEPVSIYRIQKIFLTAVTGIVSEDSVSLIQVVVAINGKVATPDEHTGLISGDQYGYFATDSSMIVVRQYE